MIHSLPLVLALLCVANASDVEATMTPAERALLLELGAGRFIKARAAAEKILITSPTSFVATWAMARVHHDEEGNHARALYYLKRADELLGNRDRQWSMKVLLEQREVLGEMSRNVEELEVLDRYEARFGAPPEELRVWALMKLRRFEEAKQIALRLTASNDEGDRATGYNGMVAIHFELHDRAESYRWAMEGVQATRSNNCTLVLNAGTTAYNRFRIAQAEELMIRSDKSAHQTCISSYFNDLAGLYVMMGEPTKALAALASSRGRAIDKRYRPQFALVRRAVLSDLLTTLGKGAEAEKIAAELYRQPSRIGMVSGSASMEKLARSLRFSLTLDGQITLLREQASYGPLLSGSAAVLGQISQRMATRWEVRRALVQLLAEDQNLVMLTRPNLGDVNDWATWRTADLAGLLGVGVMQSALARARLEDAAYPEAVAYFDALACELAFRSGSLADAERFSAAALKGLPREEALLRWRTAALRAEGLWRLGRGSEALVLWQEVMQRWPTALRILGLKLPASVSTDDSELANETAARLRRSIRFAIIDDGPFKLKVESRGGQVDICLNDASGARLSCASGEGATASLEAFHGAAFSPKVSLTETDLRSLDGSPVRVSADEALKKVLGP